MTSDGRPLHLRSQWPHRKMIIQRNELLVSKIMKSNDQKGISKKQILDLFEWEGKDEQMASEFYEKHREQLLAGKLDYPEIVDMIHLSERRNDKRENYVKTN